MTPITILNTTNLLRTGIKVDLEQCAEERLPEGQVLPGGHFLAISLGRLQVGDIQHQGLEGLVMIAHLQMQQENVRVARH